ncbi:YlxQ family RNA-binding protein [Heyndrickxia ginsengihumi]|uniref:YlxQ family RNA-binding protein n=1 Tax=Heyndrickxia ginsengihumi TaxID=363870 RepID=A0A6M0P5B2_9BACI|nr:YlxQ family RNA-binding protein [Heyndrickxia ginsengihumi]MBE6182793.1 YlxQ family RNA-binding protein [Bacillus sp. (in: firmicutes)]MCM3022533.1 YlxQ family RNA-binding protein [Heyndrickxia ginsengihumi]NEY19653.1 YlxQ family RNA-binding protein [Heyndrickxia ginsengihumi]
MSEQQAMSLLGLANRARKVISGEELVIKEIQSSRAKLIILSKDASSNTSKKIQDKCRFYNTPIQFVETRETLGKAIGKEARVVVAITEKGFAQKLAQLLGES